MKLRQGARSECTGHAGTVRRCDRIPRMSPMGPKQTSREQAWMSALGQQRTSSHSSLIFAVLMIGHHLSISALWKAARAAGVCCSREGSSKPIST